MRDSLLVRVARHAVLILFSIIALYPALNVLSISLRPGNRLRSTDLSIIPPDWTLDSYRQLFTEQPFVTWLMNSMIVSVLVTVTGVVLAAVGGYAFSRFRFVGRDRRDVIGTGDPDVSCHDVVVAALRDHRQACTW